MHDVALETALADLAMGAPSTISQRLAERVDELEDLLYEFRKRDGDAALQKAVIDDLFNTLNYVLNGTNGNQRDRP